MTETIIVGAIGSASLAVAALVTLVWVRMKNYRQPAVRPPAGEEHPSISAGSAERWGPMLRLMRDSDADYVKRQVHCPQVAAEWERARRRIIRLYLRELAADFLALHREAREMVAHSPEQFSGLVPILFRQQYSFWRALAWIELRLTLGAFGLPEVNAEALLRALEETRREIARVMTPAGV